MPSMRFLSYAFLVLTLFIMGCEDDDPQNTIVEIIDPTPQEEEEVSQPLSYFSLFQDDIWEYDVTVDEMESTPETLEVIGTTTIDGALYSDLEASAESASFMNILFAAGALTEVDGKLLYTGEVAFPLDEENEILLDVPLFTIYDSAIESADILVDQFTQTITQEIENIPVTVTAIVSSTSGVILNNQTLNGLTFESTLSSTIEINVSITADILGIPVAVLPSQNVFVISNIYGENVGLVQSNVTFEYEFIDVTPFGIELPFPQTASATTDQLITAFEVTGDD